MGDHQPDGWAQVARTIDQIRPHAIRLTAIPGQIVWSCICGADGQRPVTNIRLALHEWRQHARDAAAA